MIHQLYTATIDDPETTETLELNILHTKKGILILRALNHKLRQQILALLDERRKVIVTDIYVALRLEQSVTSQHLGILRRAGLVNAVREGKYIFYVINYKRIKEINAYVEQLLG